MKFPTHHQAYLNGTNFEGTYQSFNTCLISSAHTGHW